jgi:hypothetical protein
MLPDQIGIGRSINAIDFVSSHVAFNPLNFGAEFGQHSAGDLGNLLELISRQVTGSRDFSLDHELWHVRLLSSNSVYRARPNRSSVNTNEGPPGARLSGKSGALIEGTGFCAHADERANNKNVNRIPNCDFWKLRGFMILPQSGDPDLQLGDRPPASWPIEHLRALHFLTLLKSAPTRYPLFGCLCMARREYEASSMLPK